MDGTARLKTNAVDTTGIIPEKELPSREVKARDENGTDISEMKRNEIEQYKKVQDEIQANIRNAEIPVCEKDNPVSGNEIIVCENDKGKIEMTRRKSAIAERQNEVTVSENDNTRGENDNTGGENDNTVCEIDNTLPENDNTVCDKEIPEPTQEKIRIQENPAQKQRVLLPKGIGETKQVPSKESSQRSAQTDTQQKGLRLVSVVEGNVDENTTESPRNTADELKKQSSSTKQLNMLLYPVLKIVKSVKNQEQKPSSSLVNANSGDLEDRLDSSSSMVSHRGTDLLEIAPDINFFTENDSHSDFKDIHENDEILYKDINEALQEKITRRSIVNVLNETRTIDNENPSVKYNIADLTTNQDKQKRYSSNTSMKSFSLKSESKLSTDKKV